MALLQINDIRKNNNSIDKNEEIAIGIDLGTTNSVVAYVNSNNQVNVLEIEGSNLIPSIISYNNGVVDVGLSVLKNKSYFSSMKRFMGKSMNDFSKENPTILYKTVEEKSHKTITFMADNIELTTEEIIADLLKYLKINASNIIGQDIKKAVITVPAYFDEAARQATKNAAYLAGLEVLRLINEPTAAALAYGLDEKIEGNYIIYDYGGGTFDVSILSMTKGVFKVIATSGSLELGGDDIDNDLVKFIIDNLNISECSNDDKIKLIRCAKQIKEDLNITDKVELAVTIAEINYKVIISQQDLHKIMEPWVNKTLVICKHALQDANLDSSQIEGIVLVGGSTRSLYVQRKVEKFFKITPLCSLNPDEVVAIGAAYQANNLIGKGHNALLLDVIPLSLGLEIAGGIVEKIIPRNSPIPIKKAQEFTTYKDNQTSMLIHILQGERELVQDLRTLGRFSLKGIPPMVAGAAKILVTFIVDADGLLTVEAIEQTTGSKQSIEIKPSWGLNIDDMRTMIEKSYQNAQADIQERLLIQSKVEADIILNKTRSSLNNNRDLISENQVKEIQNIIDLLEKAQQEANKNLIDDLIKKLDVSTKELAHRIMERNIKLALEGKNIKEAEKIVDN